MLESHTHLANISTRDVIHYNPQAKWRVLDEIINWCRNVPHSRQSMHLCPQIVIMSIATNLHISMAIYLCHAYWITSHTKENDQPMEQTWSWALSNLHQYCSATVNLKPYPREQSLCGQHGAHLGPVGPIWASCWPHEPCYQSYDALHAAPFEHGWICVVSYQN